MVSAKLFIIKGRVSDVATCFDARGQQSEWLSLTEIKNSKKNILIIEFVWKI